MIDTRLKNGRENGEAKSPLLPETQRLTKPVLYQKWRSTLRTHRANWPSLATA